VPDHAPHPIDYTNWCDRCGYCKEACQCPKCTGCGEKGFSACNVCKDCRDCCAKDTSECGAAKRGGDYFPFNRREFQFFSATNYAQRRRNPSARELSVELETNVYTNKAKGGKLHRALEKWGDGVVEDGSIGSGREINTNPSGGDLFLDHIREICEGFEPMGVGATDLCGMHVHVNAKDITFYDLRRVIQLYDRVERALFDACHPKRLNYKYSLKCGDFFAKTVTKADPLSYKQEIYAALYNGKTNFRKAAPKKDYDGRPLSSAAKHRVLQNRGREVKDQLGEKSHSLRYKALNLHSYFHRGSIEFRHHEGCTDYNVITGFARVCGEIINAANRMTEKQIADLPKNSRKAMSAILSTELQEFIVGEWTKNDAIRNKTPEYARKRSEIWSI
jgi:hypothetical protein